MKKLLVLISILFMSSLIGCGTKDESEMYTIVKASDLESMLEDQEPSITPTIEPTTTPEPTVEPTPTPVPELTELEKKYQYYDSSYGDVDELAATGTPEELEDMMTGSSFYAVWYSMNDATYNQEFKFGKYEINDRAYGVKCAIYEDAGTFIIYYFYLDDPETILCASSLISEDGIGYYILTDGDNYYSSMSAEEIEAYLGIGSEEEYTPEYIPMTVEELYPYAKDSARRQAESELGLTLNDLVFGGFSYDHYFNVFYDYDGQGNYFLRFMMEYHKGSYDITMTAEVEYIDRDFDGRLDLKDVDLEY